MPKPKRPVEHEGARESLKPGEPRERQVIAPDWAELEKRQHKGDKPASARAVRKLPANKRGRG